MDKPHSAASERNREPILAVLQAHFAHRRRVLEIGSGTGQHAAHFARNLPQLVWQASDVQDNLAGIRAWLDEAALINAPPPLTLDVNDPWPAAAGYDAAFTANTLHIMSWEEVRKLFAHLDQSLAGDATLVVYGPFNYDGRYTSPSNASFDASLKLRGPHMGIRDFEAVNALAADIGLQLSADVAMPANNRTLVWRR